MSSPAPAARRKHDLLYEDLCRRFRDALLAGSAKTAEQVADQALAIAQDSAAVEARVLAPAMWMVGEFWEQARISVALGARGSAKLESYELIPVDKLLDSLSA